MVEKGYIQAATSDSDSNLDDVEMQEREEYTDGAQDRRLLDEDYIDDVTYKVEWHLRTCWAVLGSILALVAVFGALAIFTKVFIVQSHSSGESDGVENNFRRSPKSYILDPKWDFNAVPKVRVYNWTVVNIVANPDGVYRPMLTINGKFPGPMIECNEGDTLVIEVDNQSVNATSVHFHGLFMNGTNWMDGTTGITQCPIAPKRKFTYEFKVSGQSGTYYYHGHQGAQLVDGLYGPLVIHSRKEKEIQKIPYVSDRVIMLQDYYHDPSSGLLMSHMQPGVDVSPIPNGALINGYNQRDCSTLPHRMCDNSTATLPSFDLAANANHRLRFLNVGAFAWFQVSVDEHEFAITEVDGTDILPWTERRLRISPAQRYSVIVNTTQTTGDAFWLRARMVSHCWSDATLPGPDAVEARGIVQYTGGSKSPAVVRRPESKNWQIPMELLCKDMDTRRYQPVEFDPAPLYADHSYYVETKMEIRDYKLHRGYFNGSSSFRANLQNPTLHRTVEGLSSGNESFNAMRATDGVNSVAYNMKDDLVIQHSGIKVIDIIVQNYDPGKPILLLLREFLSGIF